MCSSPAVARVPSRRSSVCGWGWLLAIIALAGPVTERQPVPVFETRPALVVLFDLSISMELDDLPPSRLANARFKLRDLLTATADVQVALVAFSERPYVISPLTDDAATVQGFVASLSPAIMPVSGSRLDLAIERGTGLLTQAGVGQGQLVIFSDADATEADAAAAAVARQAGHRVSVLAVGTAEGAPLRNAEGQTYVDSAGEPIVPRLQIDELRAVSDAGGGSFSTLASDGRDLDALWRVQASLGAGSEPASGEHTGAETGTDGQSDDRVRQEQYWVDRGPWAVVVLTLGALALFRRGIVT